MFNLYFEESIINNLYTAAKQATKEEIDKDLLYKSLEKIESYSYYNEDFKELYKALYILYA